MKLTIPGCRSGQFHGLFFFKNKREGIKPDSLQFFYTYSVASSAQWDNRHSPRHSFFRKA